jgi:F0F1-type ATP synthase assembly protein I
MYYEIPFIFLFYTAAGFYIGIKIDEFMKNPMPVFTIVCGMTGLALGIWTVVKKISK